MRDRAVVVADDLTHLIPNQSRAALTSATILDELDKTKSYEHDSREAEDKILEDLRLRLDSESKEIHGRGFGWDATDLHPLLVACDSSILKVDLRQKKKLSEQH